MDDRYHEEWTHISRTIRELFNYHCAWCGKDCHDPATSHDALQVHHIDEDPSNNRPENLIPLCAVCHLRIEKEARLHAPYHDQQLELFAGNSYLKAMNQIREAGLHRYGSSRPPSVARLSPEEYERWEMEFVQDWDD